MTYGLCFLLARLLKTATDTCVARSPLLAGGRGTGPMRESSNQDLSRSRMTGAAKRAGGRVGGLGTGLLRVEHSKL